MFYLEFLRVRRAFMWYVPLLVVVSLVIIVGAIAGNHANFDTSSSSNGHEQSIHVHGFSSLGVVGVPVQAIAAIAGILALLFSTTFAASFNRTSQHAHFTFVRPVSRIGMATAFVAVDVAAIVVANLIAVAIAFITVSGSLQAHARFDWSADALGMEVLGLGCAVMWYGVLQAVSAWTAERRGSGIYVGVTIAILCVANPLSHATFLGPIAQLFGAILYIDPLAYFSSVTIDAARNLSTPSVFVAPLAVRAAIVWTLAAASIVLATFEWKRVEI